MKPALIVCATLLVAACGAATAQNAAQMEYDRQQREYWRQQEQQRQEQQRQQQVMQENARQQQAQMSRINAPGGAGPAPMGGGAQPYGGARAGYQNGADALSAARETWSKRPPLPAERNPLLGRWTRPPSANGNSSDPFAQLQALARGGLCAALFGGGVFEFKQDMLVGMDERTRPQELDRVEYRGNEKHVVVIPRTTLKLMQFDIDGPNRISWTGQNCVLVRVAGGPKAR